MSRSIRTPFVLSFTVVLAAGTPCVAPLGAQRADAVRRAPRAEPSDAEERERRRLERRADSLAQLYSEGEDLSLPRLRAIGDELDRTVQQLAELSRRAAAEAGRRMTVRVQLPSMIDERDATAMASALRQAGTSHIGMPRGWLGIVVSGTAREPRIENGELIIRYLMHPEIVSVEPSSPAERAGLAPNDTLVAYDGRDVRDRDISLTRLLRPNARVLVRIRREGRTKDVPVTIADVPSRIRIRTEASLEQTMPRSFGAIPEAAAFPRGPVPAVMPAPRAPMGAGVTMPAMPPMPAPPTPELIFGYGYNSVAGAQLAVLTEGLGRAVGVRRGVLVTQAPVGSPAHDSGLRDGDVIVRVEGDPVSTVIQLRERVRAAVLDGAGSVSVDYVRDRKPHTLRLRWQGR